MSIQFGNPDGSCRVGNIDRIEREMTNAFAAPATAGLPVDQSANARIARVLALLVLLLFTSVEAQAFGAPAKTCTRVMLQGDVEAGKQWQAALGEGWVFRLQPINTPREHAGERYSGWDLIVDREQQGESGYPDALLLGTPPYGSLNEREVGTTFGMRAQDAIAWEPRHFHFLRSINEVKKARELYRQLMMQKPGLKSEVERSAEAKITTELLTLVTDPTHVSEGTFSIVDAKLVAGVGDPAAYAQQWAAHLARVPHTSAQNAGPASQLGALRWIRFTATLWLPGHWQLPARSGTALHADLATCAQ